MSKSRNTPKSAKPELISKENEEVASITPAEESEFVIETPTPVKANILKPTEALELGLKSYVKHMNPVNPMDVEEGCRHQKKLRSTLINAIMDPSEKQAVANIHYILKFIHEDNTKTFKLDALLRFYDVTTWSTKNDRKEIETLIMLFESTADPKLRTIELKRMDFSNLQIIMAPNRADIIMRRLRIAYNLV